MRSWVAELNASLDPTRLTVGSAKYARLRCRMCDVPYQVQIRHFKAGHNCRSCGIVQQSTTARRPAPGRSIAELRPDLTAEWDDERNDVSAMKVAARSNTPARWWRCPVDNRHRYDMAPSDRWRGDGCPYCSGHRAGFGNDLAARYPHLAREWVSACDRPDLTPSTVTPFSHVKVSWRCQRDPRHQWAESVAQRTSRPSCPFCTNIRIDATNNLVARRPDLATEWHPRLNAPLRPEQVGPGATQRVFWQCASCDHTWEAAVVERSGNPTRPGTGCPPCSLIRRGRTRRRPGKGESLAELHPDLARQWHPTRNSPDTPSDIRPGSSYPKRWWVCAAGHEWLAAVASRVEGRGCRTCAGQQATPERNLAVDDPEIAATWHPELNGALLPTDVTYKSGRQVYWLCAESHVWEQRVSNRVRSRRCGECTGRLVSASNNLAALHPGLAVEWDTEANWPLQPHQMHPGSLEIVAWCCWRGHTWETSIANRARLGSGCSRCQMSATSALEIRLYAELAHVLSRCNFAPQHGPRLDDPRVPARYRSVDMLFTDDGGGVVVEFDGSYWHTLDRSRNDRRKTDALLDADYGVLRVREAPLECRGEEDVPVPKNQQAHLTAAAVLERMRALDWLRTADLAAIDDYLRAGRAVAEDRAEFMIRERGGYDLASSAAAIRSRASQHHSHS
ncbi:zinc-ribbon domain-containing protein [Streptomyces avermitilis]|uniref:zinc-ribbon domain-containing protein n=1 Tax=Streptomyces avermitilis TaxID=33903 RepID=UPI0033FDDEC1